MWVERARLQFRMKLRAEEERMDAARELGDLHEATRRRHAGEHKPALFQALHVRRVYLKAMPMPFGDFA